MKIQFIIGDPPLFTASNWNEIIKWNKKGFSGYSYEDYSKVIGLETVNDFEDEIIKSRINLNIPKEGFDHNKIIEIIALPNPFKPEVNKERENIQTEVKRLNEIFIFDKFVKRQLSSLILGNFVLPSETNPNFDGDINYEVHDDDDDQENNTHQLISINITSPIKKGKLIRFINDNWGEIVKKNKDKEAKKINKNNQGLLGYDVSRIRTKIKFNLEDKELQIYNLKIGSKKSFEDIADDIVATNNLNNLNDETNGESVKTSYYRTKDKIESLVKRK